jgi:hypothetical protein
MADRAFVINYYNGTNGEIGCVEMSGVQFEEPFFSNSVAKHIKKIPRPLQLTGDAKEVVDVLRGQAALPPCGLVFHTSRCGSTLLSNALSELRQVMVLKEPNFLSSLSAQFLAESATTDAISPRIANVLRCCLPPTTPSHLSLILKFSSWNVLVERSWSQIISTCPRAFLWRPCTEVVESFMATPPRWMRSRNLVTHPAFAYGRSVLESANISDLPEPVAVGAAAWLCTARKGADLGRAGALIMSYSSVAGDLVASLTAVCKHFGIDAAPEEVLQAAEVRNFYSKDEPGHTPFIEVRRPSLLDWTLRDRLQAITHELESELLCLGIADPGSK